MMVKMVVRPIAKLSEEAWSGPGRRRPGTRACPSKPAAAIVPPSRLWVESVSLTTRPAIHGAGLWVCYRRSEPMGEGTAAHRRYAIAATVSMIMAGASCHPPEPRPCCQQR